LDGMAKDDPLADFGERLLAMSEPPKRGRRKKNKKRKKGDAPFMFSIGLVAQRQARGRAIPAVDHRP